MTLPASGPISFNNINVELGVAGTTQASLGQASYRTLAGVASGAISMSNFYGKSNRVSVSYTFSSNTANATLAMSSIGGYVAGASDITITVNSGIYLYSTSTGTPGLNLTGGTSGDVITLVNNGFIMGQGGVGCAGDIDSSLKGSGDGGTALSLGFNTTVNNTNGSAYIGGGGGGGGRFFTFNGSGGGGAGGGAGGSNPTNSATGGAGGGIGASGGQSPTSTPIGAFTGAGGGRIFSGTGGAGATSAQPSTTAIYVKANGGGAGGGGPTRSVSNKSRGPFAGGAGGSGSSAGATGNPGGGGGGGWGAAGGLGDSMGFNSSLGGAGGKAVALNGYSITWTAGNTTRVYGAVS